MSVLPPGTGDDGDQAGADPYRSGSAGDAPAAGSAPWGQPAAPVPGRSLPQSSAAPFALPVDDGQQGGAPPPGGPPAPLGATTYGEEEEIVPRGATRRHKRRRRRRLIIEWLVVLAVAAGVAVFLRAFVVQAFFVPSSSMEPTLDVGDRILVVKTSLLTGPITRGSIVVFQHPKYFPCSTGSDDDIEDLVKRVIGLPGETIWSTGNTIYINGKALNEPGWYRAGFAQVGATPINRQVIPTGDYFVMGDNRTDSCDSRAFGPIPASSIVGQVELIVWRNGHPYFHAF